MLYPSGRPDALPDRSFACPVNAEEGDAARIARAGGAPAEAPQGRVRCAVCELVELPRAVVEADWRPCTCGGTTWYEVPPCDHAGLRLVLRNGRQEGWCPTCGWSQGGKPKDSVGGGVWHMPLRVLRAQDVTCAHPLGGSWCVHCGAVKDETPTRGYAGPVWECPVDAQRRTNLRALTDKPKTEDTLIAKDKREAAPQADAQRKAFVAVRPMLPPIGETAPVCVACANEGPPLPRTRPPTKHRCTFFAPSETSILCGRWLCEAHAGHAIEGGAVLCPEHLPLARALLDRRREPKP